VGLLALEASSGGLGLALAGLLEPGRENMDQVFNAEERAILESNAADVRAQWGTVLRNAQGSFRKSGDAGVLCVWFLVGSIGKQATVQIIVKSRYLAHSLLSQEDEQYDKPIPFEAVLIAKQKQCKQRVVSLIINKTQTDTGWAPNLYSCISTDVGPSVCDSPLVGKTNVENVRLFGPSLAWSHPHDLTTVWPHPMYRGRSSLMIWIGRSAYTVGTPNSTRSTR
jgi:hypothetical protein